MANLFVFGIGGTGERVMRSFVMLMAAGIPSLKGWDVYPVIIDYDKANGDKSRVGDLLEKYSNVNRAAYKRHGSADDEFFGSTLKELDGLNHYILQYDAKVGQDKFCDYIGYNDLGGPNLKTKYLLSTLYDDSNEKDAFKELNLDMTVGFKGNPNIGSVVFHKLEETKAFKTLITVATPNDKIIVVGSLFGGTGASGIPELVYALNKHLPKVPLATLLILPYFAPKNVNGGVIDASRFNAKTKAAIKYYQDSGLMDKISRIYYMGDAVPTKIQYCEGGRDQKNNANIVELLSAMSIEHFLRVNNNSQKEYKFSINLNLTGKSVNGIASRNRIYINDFDQESKEWIFKYTTSLALALKYYHDAICEDKVGKKTAYMDLLGLSSLDNKKTPLMNIDHVQLQNVCAYLYAFYDEYQVWLKELDYEGDTANKLDANEHRLALYDMTKNYSEMVLSQANMVETKLGIIDKLKKELKSTNKMDVCDEMSSTMDSYYDKYSGAKETNDSVVEEFQFMDILRKSAMEVSLKLS